MADEKKDMRQKDANWNIYTPIGGASPGWTPGAQLAVLMDIRDELQTLNRLLGCHNAVAIPTILRDIAKNTKKPKRKPARKPRSPADA